MLGPDLVRGSVVVDAGEVRKIVERVGDGDPELVHELARRGAADAWFEGREFGVRSAVRSFLLSSDVYVERCSGPSSSSDKGKARERRLTDLVDLVLLAAGRKRVRAARVGPHLGEGDLLVRALLEEELARGRVEEEDGKGAVERRARRRRRDQVAYFLGGRGFVSVQSRRVRHENKGRESTDSPSLSLSQSACRRCRAGSTSPP